MRLRAMYAVAPEDFGGSGYQCPAFVEELLIANEVAKAMSKALGGRKINVYITAVYVDATLGGLVYTTEESS